jgi:hypothetical protein
VVWSGVLIRLLEVPSYAPRAGVAAGPTVRITPDATGMRPWPPGPGGLTVCPMLAALDPNWLMSTAAQSAAAIVAIVGGFLVSRLIAANSEKAALRRRLQEVNLRVTQSTSDQAQAEASLLTFEASALVQDNVDFIMAKNGGVTADELLQRSPRTQWTGEKLAPQLSALLEDYARAFTALSELPDGLLDQEWKGVTVGLELGDLSEEQDEIWSSVYSELTYRFLVKKKPRTSGLTTAIMDPMPPRLFERDTSGSGVRRQLAEARPATQRHLATAQSEAKYVQQAIEGLPSASDLWGGFAVLAFFSISGVLLPLFAIATQSSEVLSFERKAMVIGGFVAGLLVLAGYLVRQIQRLDSAES